MNEKPNWGGKDATLNNRRGQDEIQYNKPIWLYTHQHQKTPMDITDQIHKI